MKKRTLAGKINNLLTLLLIVLLLPLLITILYQKMQINQLFLSVPQSNEISEDMTEKLVGIVAKEINADASFECMKAQCVIARTNLLAAEETDTKPPDGMSLDEMKESWGNYFPEFYQKLEQAVNETEGETLQYKNTYIYAAYHAVSAGKTRNMKELYPESDMPYLSSVECFKDCSADNYLAVLYWSKKEFIELCQRKFPDAVIGELTDVEILQKDSTGYVTLVRIGEKQYTGEEFRSALNLNSADFSIKVEAENVRIVTKGLGHGFGFSQNYAEKMVEDGSDYKDLLNYFFPGAKLHCSE